MPKTILIVEDCSIIRSTIAVFLKNAGYTVLEAVDGEDGLLQLNSIEVHLIITDISMPNINGIDFIRLVQKIPQYQQVPVIVQSSYSAEFNDYCPSDIKVHAWYDKLINPEQINEVVQLLI